MGIAKRLYATDETYQEVADLLFGGGADDLVSKTTAGQDHKKRAITAALSGVGATAGAAGLGLAVKETSHAIKHAPKPLSMKGKLIHAAKSKKLATGLIPLEVAGLGGELMATKILHGDTKKQHVAKMEPSGSDLHTMGVPTKGKLRKLALDKGTPMVKTGTLKAKAAMCKSFTFEGEISKVDDDKRQVFGWASIVELNGEPVVDLQGDYIDIDEIEKSAYEYVIKSRKGGDMHRRNTDATPVKSSDMIESFLVTPEKIEKMGLPDTTPIGWWVGYQVNDEDAWQLVKSGQRTGFSIHGRGHRTSSEI